MTKTQATAQLKACEAVLSSNAGTDAIVFAVLGKRAALKVLTNGGKES
jgi:hypothetical protein